MVAEPNHESYTVGELSVRWHLSLGEVSKVVAEEGLSDLTRPSVLAFEATSRGKRIVLRAIRIDSEEVLRTHTTATREVVDP